MKRISPLLLATLFAAGCATVGQPQFNVSVDSLASPLAAGKRTYLLLPGNEGVTWDDLQFQEYAGYVMRVLNAHGFVPAKSVQEADVAILLAYGIGDPQTHQYTYSLPTWGQTGVSSATTTGSAASYGNTTSYSGTTTYTPTYGVTGYNTYSGSVTTFFRYVLLNAYDYTEYKRSQKLTQLWQTTIGSSGASGDLRRVFPILIGASVPFIARNTGQRKSVTLYETDKIVRAVKGEAVE